MNEAKRNDIVRYHQQGLSQRRIAKLLRVSRHTVADVLEQVAQERSQPIAHIPDVRGRSRRSLNAYARVIEQLLAGYVESSLLCGRDFRNLEHLNEVTAWWLANVADVRVHGETRQRPVDRHAEEVPHLLPLPAVAYDVAVVVYRHVSAEGLVVWQGNYYSTPWRLIGRLLAVRITADEVIVYGSQLDEVARHRLLPVAVGAAHPGCDGATAAGAGSAGRRRAATAGAVAAREPGVAASFV